MSIALVYVIKLLVLPPASLIISSLGGFLCRKHRLGIWITKISLILLLGLSLPVVVALWGRNWERFPALTTDQVKLFKPQALVVIGGGTQAHAAEYSTSMTVNSRTLLRLRYAAKLARQQGLPILVSGGRVMGLEGLSEADLMAEVLGQEFKTPAEWLETQSRDTAENARFSRKVLQRFAINRVVLVTQAYHMPRAEREFRKAGFEVLAAPTDFIGGHLEFTIFDFLPSASALMNSFLLAHENLGMLWYRIRYAG